MKQSQFPRSVGIPRLDPQHLSSLGSSIEIDQFHHASSDHRPAVTARLGHDNRSLLIRFDVQDRYVLARAQHHQEPVAVDSCVEFFVEPRAGRGYFNFEVNCGGTMLCYFIEDWRLTPSGFVKHRPLTTADLQQVTIRTSMPQTVWPERADPVLWFVELDIPISVMENYVGPIGPLAGQAFRANFYKCADGSSHPHWAAWSPIGDQLNFHQPEHFGQIDFE